MFYAFMNENLIEGLIYAACILAAQHLKTEISDPNYCFSPKCPGKSLKICDWLTNTVRSLFMEDSYGNTADDGIFGVKLETGSPMI